MEAALNDFVDLILKDFVINMWYADITPDMEFPELVRDLIMDAIAEVSARVKEINLVDLLTRCMIFPSSIIYLLLEERNLASSLVCYVSLMIAGT